MAARRVGGIWINDSGELSTIVTNADGSEVGAVGGGTEYTEGDSDSSATGPVILARDTDGNFYPPSETHPLSVRQASLTAANDFVSASGNVAHDAVDSGSPIKIGGKARTTNPTAVADADRVDAMFDKLGRQVVILGQVRDLRATQSTTITSSTTETTILTAGAAGVLHDVTNLIITNSSATDVVVTIRDDTAGTAVMFIGVKAGCTAGFAAPQAVPQTAAAKNWTAQCSASVASVSIFVQANKVV